MMARSNHQRPKPGVSLPSEDNRVPDIGEHEFLRPILSHAFAWLLHGRPAGRGRIGPARPTIFRVWLPWLLPLLTVALGAAMTLASWPTGLLTRGVLWLACIVFGSLALAATVIAAAIAHTLPPPRRPRCEEETLPTGRPRPARPPTSTSPLFEYVSNEIWIAERPLVFYGLAMGTRMTLLRLENGGLLIHSPVAHDRDLEAAVRAVGEPVAIVAPNAIHHLFVDGWRAAFPDAPLVAAPGLLARRPDLAPALEWPLSPNELPWNSEEVRVACFEGHPMHREIALYHERSSTLVLSDMIENLGHEDDGISPMTRRLLDLAMMSGRPAPPTDYKLTVDREVLARSLEPMWPWRFERIVLAHGKLVERDARQIFRDAFAFVV